MERVRGIWTLSYLLPLVIAMGCSLSTSSLNDQSSSALDTTPPTFSGLSSVTSVDMTRAILSWNPAVDDSSPSANIVYLIWTGNQPGISTSASPSYVAPPTSTSFEVPGLPPYRPAYFVVRAKDGARNLETNTVELVTTPASGRWDFVDGGQASGIDTSDIVRSTSMAAVDNHLFAMWVEAPTSGLMQYCRVAEYNRNDAAPVWSLIDNGPVTGGGLNYDPSRVVGSSYNDITLTAFQSRLYAGWVEYDSISSAYQFRVAVYDPARPLSGWKFVEHSPIDHNGINVDVTASASAPNLVAGDGALWAVWQEIGVGPKPGQIRVARYNGDDSSP
ncbi:MAG TPA: fibronectin type III domain-containing protein, partial [Spirochaetia bacterium]|nr:fibronectin type III domain-containing protein [Spirochaetia bacterium]